MDYEDGMINQWRASVNRDFVICFAKRLQVPWHSVGLLSLSLSSFLFFLSQIFDSGIYTVPTGSMQASIGSKSKGVQSTPKFSGIPGAEIYATEKLKPSIIFYAI